MEEDKRIVAKIIAGDINQYELLVKKHQQAVYRIILKITGDTENAKEVTQVVFVKAYESIKQYKPDYKFFSWIYRIAINSALMYVKQNKIFTPIEQLKEMASDSEPDSKRDQSKLLNEALQQLPEKYLSVIVLKYYAGNTYPEIAEIKGIDEKRVKSRLFDGRKILKDILVSKGIFLD